MVTFSREPWDTLNLFDNFEHETTSFSVSPEEIFEVLFADSRHAPEVVNIQFLVADPTPDGSFTDLAELGDLLDHEHTREEICPMLRHRPVLWFLVGEGKGSHALPDGRAGGPGPARHLTCLLSLSQPAVLRRFFACWPSLVSWTKCLVWPVLRCRIYRSISR